MILDRIRTSRRKSLELLFLGGLLSAPRAILAQTPGTLPVQPIRMDPVADSARPAWPASHLTAVSNVDQPVRVEYCPRPHYPHTPPVLGYPVTVELVFVVDTRGRAGHRSVVRAVRPPRRVPLRAGPSGRAPGPVSGAAGGGVSWRSRVAVLSLPLEQLASSLGLGIGGVLDLVPGGLTPVGIVLPLGNDSLQIQPACRLE
jgi:hypothetical protein